MFRPAEKYVSQSVSQKSHLALLPLHISSKKMGRVRTKTVKKAAKVIIEKYYSKCSLDFHTNKRVCEEVAIIPSKPLRNKIAGYVTHLMKRLEHKTVQGISIKLQEEERERKDNYVPEVSALEEGPIKITSETRDMLHMLKMTNIPYHVVASSEEMCQTEKEKQKKKKISTVN